MKSPSPSWRDLPISIVLSATETKTKTITCGEALEGILSGRWEKPVKRVRDKYASAFDNAVQEGSPDPAAAAKKAVLALKRSLPGITFSGTFLERADNQLVNYSGVFCVDLDGCGNGSELKTRLAGDEYVQAFFDSPTGSGLKVLLRVVLDASMHLGSFTAAGKHFQEVHGVAIDPACKNLSRLCYVAHDADAFIRNEDAKILEPLLEEKLEAAATKKPEAADAHGELEGLMFLPKAGHTTYTASAATIYGRISERQPPEMFTRGRSVVTIEKTTEENGAIALDITDTSAHTFRAYVERHGTLFEWQAGPHGPLLKTDALMSVDTANVLLTAQERFQLPPLAMVHHCPLLIERDGAPVVLGQGYHRDLGGRYITSSVEIQKMSLDEAAGRLLELIVEFPFVSEADLSRAIASIVTPALRFGGLLRCHFPTVLVEADRPQAGKGTLVEAIQCFYGEPSELTSKRKGGVGSFDEDLSRQMLRGRPFIQIDNVREALDSQFFEQALTCPFVSTITARVPHKAGISVNPNRHIFHLTSNKFESTQDLAARSCVIRLQKRDGYAWKKFDDGKELLDHLEANFATVISIVYAIASHWVASGKPRSENELRGEGRFRKWWQVADWIAKTIFDLPSPLDGHEKIQSRVASAAQSWVRAMGNILKAEGFLDIEIAASQLVEMASRASDDVSVKIPGVDEKADENDKARRVGIIMAQLFKGDVEKIEVDAYQITRIERDEYRSDARINQPRKYYVFKLLERR